MYTYHCFDLLGSHQCSVPLHTNTENTHTHTHTQIQKTYATQKTCTHTQIQKTTHAHTVTHKIQKIQKTHTHTHNVGGLPNVSGHETVNHSLHFVDPVTGVHTQAIESYWNRTKIKLKKMKGVSENQLPSRLDEFMWRERYGQTHSIAFYSIIDEISRQYPV